MNLKRIVGLLSIFALAVGCGVNAKVNTDEVNGVDANKAKFAIFAEEIQILDLDADGEEDDAITGLLVAIADDPALCDLLLEDPNLENQADIVAAVGIAVKVELDAEGGFAAGDNVVGDNEEFIVDSGILVFENNVEIANTFGDGDGTFVVEDLLVDELLTAAFVSTMTVDVADEDNFDLDLNADGVNDAKEIDAAFNAEFKADFCNNIVIF